MGKNLYNNLVREGMGDDNFRMKVEVDLFMPGDKDTTPEDTMVTFQLPVEYREWGIKSILALVIGSITVNYIWRDPETDEEEERSVTIEAGDVEIEWQSADFYGPISLSINLSEDGAVESAVLNFGYISH